MVVAGVLGQEVDEDEGVADDAAQAGGVLDVEPVVGVGEDDDVAVFEVLGVVYGYGHPVADIQGVLHGAGGDLEPLNDEGLEQGRERDDDDDDENRRAVRDPPTAATTASSPPFCCRFCFSRICGFNLPAY